MKKTVLILVFCFFLSPAWAAIALVSHVSAGGTGGTVTTGNSDSTGANFCALVVSYWGSGTLTSISDSKSNPYTCRTLYTSTSPDIKLCYVANPTVGSNHTFTATGLGFFASVSGACFSGVSTASPYEAENGSWSAGVSTFQPGSVTPAGSGELLITGISTSAGNSSSIDSGFTIIEQVAYSVGQHMGLSLAYLVQGTAAAINPTWTMSTSMIAATNITVFKLMVPVSTS